MSTCNLADAAPKQPERQPTAHMTHQRDLTEQDGCMLRCSTDTTVHHAIVFDGVIVDFVCSAISVHSHIGTATDVVHHAHV